MANKNKFKGRTPPTKANNAKTPMSPSDMKKGQGMGANPQGRSINKKKKASY